MKSSLLIGLLSTLLLASCGVTPEIPAPVANPITPAPIISTGGVETGSGQGQNIQTGSITSTGVSTQSGDLIFHPERLQKVKDQYGSESYSGIYLTGIYLFTYTGSQSQPQNEWIDLFRTGRYKEAGEKLIQSKELSPVYEKQNVGYPIATLPYKLGLLILEFGTDDEGGYILSYQTLSGGNQILALYPESEDMTFSIHENELFQYSAKSPFLTVSSQELKQSPRLNQSTTAFHTVFISYFTHPGTNKDFDEVLSKFKQEIDALYE